MTTSNTNQLIVVGAANAEMAKLLRAINRAAPTWKLIGYLDDDQGKWGKEFMGSPVLGPVQRLLQPEFQEVHAIVSIGSTAARRATVDRLATIAERMATLVHPGVDLWEATLGRGVLVFDGAVISPNVVVEDHTVVSFRAVLGHDAHIGPCCTIGPGAVVAGRCHIGDSVYVGSGAVLLPDVEVGAGATVGAGAVVTRNVEPGASVMGNPGRVLRLPEPAHA